VVAHLIDKHLQRGLDLASALRAAAREVHGRYALAGICEKEPERRIAGRWGCPLVVGRTKQASYVASDVMAMLAHTRDVMYLEEGDVAVGNQHEVQVNDS